jgi:glycosyltransferase involved in cell wall biosynthesis
MRALATRFHPDFSSDRVVSFSSEAIVDRARQHFFGRHFSPSKRGDAYCRFGEWFAGKVKGHLERLDLDPEFDHFLGYNTNCLETIEMLRERRIFSVVDQVDPARVEEQLIIEESERWPGWARVPGRLPQSYWDRLKTEWSLADLVLVNSEWSAEALSAQGVPKDKIIVVPLAIDLSRSQPPEPVRAESPLKVLWLGSVILRKGIQYLVQAARTLQKYRIEFQIAGPVGISQQALQSFPANMKILGRVTRDRLSEIYRQAHVFVLPTLSDGFAITQLEAMAHGLPVIATPNCGRVVTDGIDGFILPARDSEALSRRLAQLAGSPCLVRTMSANALLKARQYDLLSNAKLIDGLVEEYRQAAEACLVSCTMAGKTKG